VDVGAIRDALEWRYPRIAWFEAGWRGTTLVVRAVEGVLPREDAQDGPCDIVAERDGVIHSIVTRAGTPVVTAGLIVRAGEVLIKGEERTSDGAVKPVAARGSVTARVWVGSAVSIPAVENVTSYTGSQQTVSTIRTPFFDLWKLAACDYAQYDTAVSEMPIGGIFLPLTLRTETRMEAEITRNQREMEALREEASAAALRKLQEKTAEGESFIDIWGNCSMIEDEKVGAYAIGEKLVEIGLRAPVSGMAAPAGEDSHDQPR
jgi:similar to stage IV sporulation protein